MATEKRLIDVNKVIDQMQQCIDESPYERDSIASYTFGAIIECLKKEPTVDAVEVKHGRWEWTETGEQDYEQFWACSQCGDRTYFLTNYCHNCGANMDLKGE